MENIFSSSLRILHTFVLRAKKAYNTATYGKFANFTGLYFLHYIIFCNKIYNSMKFRMLFPPLQMNFPYSKVCRIGEWPIV